MRWIVPSTTDANCIASSRARRLVSRPSNATAHDCIGDGSPPHTITQRSAMRISEATVGPSAPWPLVVTPRRPTSTDRKSTRLNSSHLVISYAVFCLKKKKNKHTQHFDNNHADCVHP